MLPHKKRCQIILTACVPCLSIGHIAAFVTFSNCVASLSWRSSTMDMTIHHNDHSKKSRSSPPNLPESVCCCSFSSFALSLCFTQSFLLNVSFQIVLFSGKMKKKKKGKKGKKSQILFFKPCQSRAQSQRQSQSQSQSQRQRKTKGKKSNSIAV